MVTSDDGAVRRSILGIAVLVAVAACSDSGTVPTSVVPSTTTLGTMATSSTTTVAITTTTTTSTSTSTTTTTTTIPPLDRSNPATAARLDADLATLLDNGPRPAGSPSEAAALEWFTERAETITGIVATAGVVPLPNGTESANVWVGPLGEDGPLLLIGSHIDSVAVSPGIDDNGSGVVILLELMRRYTEDPPDGVRVLLVAFGAEEFVPGYDHHYGSDLAAREMADADTLPDFMLSVDMVGVGDVLRSVPYRDADRSFAEALVVAAAGAGSELVLQPRGDISDHVPFARAGVPSALLLRGDNPAWHTADDDRVEIEGVLEALAVVEALIRALEG
jgi:hypothetical protein